MSTSDSDSSSISSVEDAKAKKPPPAKKATSGSGKSGSGGAAAAKAGDKRKRQASDGEGEDTRLSLGSKRFVSLSNFRGRFFVDIREFYEDKASGELKPGKKGIALTLEQWDNLKRKVDAVDKMIKDA